MFQEHRRGERHNRRSGWPLNNDKSSDSVPDPFGGSDDRRNTYCTFISFIHFTNRTQRQQPGSSSSLCSSCSSSCSLCSSSSLCSLCSSSSLCSSCSSSSSSSSRLWDGVPLGEQRSSQAASVEVSVQRVPLGSGLLAGRSLYPHLLEGLRVYDESSLQQKSHQTSLWCLVILSLSIVTVSGLLTLRLCPGYREMF